MQRVKKGENKEDKTDAEDERQIKKSYTSIDGHNYLSIQIQ